MSMQLPQDVQGAVQGFLSGGRFEDEAAVLRTALEALERHETAVSAIQAGIDDQQAGRIRPWKDAKAELATTHGFRSN